MNIQQANALIMTRVQNDTQALEALQFLTQEANKQYQATGKQMYALSKMLDQKGVTLQQASAQYSIPLQNVDNLTKEEASALITALKK